MLNARHRINLGEEMKEQEKSYGQIAVPIEIVHGTADPIVAFDIHAKALEKRVPDAVLTPLEGIGHMPHQVATEAVSAAVDRAAARAGLN